jgi:hypothetical protein
VLARLWAFLWGDMQTAEGLGDPSTVDRVAWIEEAVAKKSDPALAYALEASRRSAEDASEAVKSVQDKASGFLTLVIGLVPLLIAAIGLAAPGGTGSLGRWAAFALFLVAAAALLGAVAMTALATGLNLGGGLNLSRLGQTGGRGLARLKADEADAWHYAAMLAMQTATRKATDLFRARQLTMWALILSVAASALMLGSVGGRIGDLGSPSELSSPSPTPSTAITALTYIPCQESDHAASQHILAASPAV